VQAITQDGETVAFTYDDADRRITMSLPNGIVAYYTYDTASRLKTLTYKRGTTLIGDLAFEYDANSRRTHVSGTLAQVISPTVFETATHDVSNRQVSMNSESMTYDANGNLVSDGVNTYTWNARDQLVAIMGPNLSANFTYDGLGRRISRDVDTITTNYVYAGLQAIEEHVNSGPVTTQVAGRLDEVFFRKSGTTTEYLLTDHLQSTWGLSDSSGNVNTEYHYDIFGQTQQIGQSSPNPLQFTGRENDGTGLYYYRNRYYSPELRRFISRDPLLERGGENEYSYVMNTPVNLTDPLGLKPPDIWNPQTPKLWRKPQFDAGPYVDPNPFTTMEKGEVTDFWNDPLGTIGRAIPYYGYNFGMKGSLGDLGSIAPRFGKSAGGVPGASEMINTLELGPDLYNTLDTVDRRNQDINDALNCAAGNCSSSPYTHGGGLGGPNNGWRPRNP